MKGILLVLLILTPLILAEITVMEEIVQRQKKIHERINEILESAEKNEQGEVTRDEYARLIVEIMTQGGNTEKQDFIRGIAEEYMLTLPEYVNYDEILEDIGLGEFSKLYMKRIHEYYNIKREL